ncbi:hypothetical protein ESCO_001389 [Escovopsis weberi]|uniref:Uncharacterized protein n=1 Tax=Escovopsis weberi TaxID=150374 RepID=A0A0M9VU11_ESCWE|nr:hypothetical protein ESCO_001389 [Escovopsis weberi]
MALKRLLALGALAQLDLTFGSSLPKTSSSQCPPRPADLPVAFDGTYLNPLPGPDVPGFDWYWFQAIAPEPTNGNIASVEVVFYFNFAFTPFPTDPPYRIDVSGVFKNGSDFMVSVPVTTTPEITTEGQSVSGRWGDVGSFSIFNDLQDAAIMVKDAASGLEGSLIFKNAGTPPHGPCSDCTTVPPYFDPLAAGQSLNDAEAQLYNKVGWATIMPRAIAQVNITVGGESLLLEDALGYHDQTWGPAGFEQFAFTWLSGQGACGPFDITYGEVQAIGSGRDKDIIKGFLAYDGQIVQNQCSRFGEGRDKDTLSVTLTGQTTDPFTGEQAPTGLVLEFTLANGTQYVFNLENSNENPAQTVYHRWRLGGKGGRVGGEQYDCALIADWLNPGGAVYSEGSSIFDEQ